jgi:hypothetical protein
MKKYSLLFSSLLWCFCILFHKKLADITYNKGLQINLLKSLPLYDVIQESLPNLQKYRIIPEVLHFIPILTLLANTIYHKHIECLKKFLVIHGILMFIRAISFSVTLLPDSSGMCQLSTHLGSCFDLLFSGHSTIMLLCCLLLNQFYFIELKWKICLFANTGITSLLIILCRNHYTIDVLYSLLMTYFVYSNF